MSTTNIDFTLNNNQAKIWLCSGDFEMNFICDLNYNNTLSIYCFLNNKTELLLKNNEKEVFISSNKTEIKSDTFNFMENLSIDIDNFKEQIITQFKQKDLMHMLDNHEKITLYISEPKDFEYLNHLDEYKYSKNIILNIDENFNDYLPKKLSCNIKKIIYPIGLAGSEYHTELLKNKGNVEIFYKKPSVMRMFTGILFLSVSVYLFEKFCK